MANGTAPTKYMTGLNVLLWNPNSVEMRNLWSQVEDDPLCKEIWSKQKDDGSWFTGGPWHHSSSYVQKNGYTPVSPKYVTTVWILGLLGEMGYNYSDNRIRKAVNWVLGWQLENGVITEDRRLIGKPLKITPPPNYPCRMSIMMAGLAKVGASADLRFERSLDLLVSWQRNDGGWLSEGHRDGSFKQQGWDRGCPWVSHFAIEALYYSKLVKYRANLIKGLNFLVWHLEIKSEEETRHIFFRGHEPISELKMLTDTGIGLKSKQVVNLIKWIESMYNPSQSHFSYNGPSLKKITAKKDKVTQDVMKFRAFLVAEDDWLTYHALGIEKNLQSTKVLNIDYKK